MPNFNLRSTEPEQMDDPNLPEALLAEVLADINTVNRLLGGNQLMVRKMRRLMEVNKQPEYHIVDMGCGDGELLRALADDCRKRQQKVTFTGVDISAKGLAIGRQLSGNYPEISFRQQDILQLNPEDFRCDFLLCNLTMHHFSNAQIPVFLRKFLELSDIAVVINDLHRSKLAYYLFQLFTAIFFKTEIAKSDGLISIASGFRRDELEKLAGTLPIARQKIAWHWAWRWIWELYPERK